MSELNSWCSAQCHALSSNLLITYCIVANSWSLVDTACNLIHFFQVFFVDLFTTTVIPLSVCCKIRQCNILENQILYILYSFKQTRAEVGKKNSLSTRFREEQPSVVDSWGLRDKKIQKRHIYLLHYPMSMNSFLLSLVVASVLHPKLKMCFTWHHSSSTQVTELLLTCQG